MAQFAHYYIKYKHDLAPFEWERRQEHLAALFDENGNVEFFSGEGEERKVYKHKVYHLNNAPQIIVMRFANDIRILIELDFQPDTASICNEDFFLSSRFLHVFFCRFVRHSLSVPLQKILLQC